MAIKKICKGDTMPYTNSTGVAIASGAPVLVSKVLGVAVKDIPIGETETLDLVGVYEIRKAKDQAINQGDNLYWNPTGQPQGGLTGQGCLTTTVGSNVYAGKAYAAAGSTALVVQIKLDN